MAFLLCHLLVSLFVFILCYSSCFLLTLTFKILFHNCFKKTKIKSLTFLLDYDDHDWCYMCGYWYCFYVLFLCFYADSSIRQLGNQLELMVGETEILSILSPVTSLTH